MLDLLQDGQYQTFALLVFTIVVSLSCHEYAHAASAKHFGDRTAEQQGRLTLDPKVHIDPLGLLMIVLVGFGWARPVPVTERFLNSRRAMPLIAFAGPLVNLALAFVAVNVYVFFHSRGFGFAATPAAGEFFSLFATINVALFLFNLVPLGPLDGHYILPHLLATNVSRRYVELNEQYGNIALMALVMLSFSGVGVFGWMWSTAVGIRDFMIVF